MAFYRASAAVFTGVVCNIRVIVPCSRKTPEGAGGPLSGVFLSSPDISEIRGQKSEIRSQRPEVRDQKSEILLWERLSAAILRSQRFLRLLRFERH
jgi:hypothetical protein